MHRYFFATKDTFINSGSNPITGEDFTEKNTGQDEILELKKVFFNRDFHYPTRALIQFDADEIESYISSSVLPSTYKLNLRLWETEGTSGLSETYAIAAYPVIRLKKIELLHQLINNFHLSHQQKNPYDKELHSLIYSKI